MIHLMVLGPNGRLKLRDPILLTNSVHPVMATFNYVHGDQYNINTTGYVGEVRNENMGHSTSDSPDRRTRDPRMGVTTLIGTPAADHAGEIRNEKMDHSRVSQLPNSPNRRTWEHRIGITLHGKQPLCTPSSLFCEYSIHESTRSADPPFQVQIHKSRGQMPADSWRA